jgi:uncharacterized membrane protein YpjA
MWTSLNNLVLSKQEADIWTALNNLVLSRQGAEIWTTLNNLVLSKQEAEIWTALNNLVLSESELAAVHPGIVQAKSRTGDHKISTFGDKIQVTLMNTLISIEILLPVTGVVLKI